MRDKRNHTIISLDAKKASDKKKIKGIQIKLSLFAEAMIPWRENPKESTRKLLEPIGNLSKVK